MKSMKKRIITTALAGTMALSLAAPAFAATNTTTKVTATYSEIPIDVTVPTTATVQINPMQMPVKLPKAGDDSAVKEIANVFASNPTAIVNNSTMDLTVGATVTGTVKGNFKFVTAAWDTTAETLPTANQAFVYLEMKKAEEDLSVADAEKFTLDVDKLSEAWEAWKPVLDESSAEALAALPTAADAVADWAKGTEDENNARVVVSTKATTNTAGLAKLDAVTTADDGTVTHPAGSVGLFRLDGLIIENPKTAWAKTDGFGATIAFTFKASKPAENNDG